MLLSVTVLALLDLFVKVRKATISLAMSVCPSVCPPIRMEQLGSHQTDLHEIWYLSIFRKICRAHRSSLTSEKNNGYFT